MRDWFWWLLVIALLLLGVLTIPSEVRAHDAPKGWTYPWSCCSGVDCRHVHATWLEENSQGFVIPTTGEVIRYNDKRVRNSPDGEYHWCSKNGSDEGKTICLFVPPRGM